jgi:hypothetical protein
VFVLDQRDAHVIVAVVAEADARGHRDLGLLEQALGEADRAELRIDSGILRPTYIDALGFSTASRLRAAPSTITSRRFS